MSDLPIAPRDCRRLSIHMSAAAVLIVLLQWWFAPAAWAVTMSLSANSGRAGTPVTVRIFDLKIPCEVRFDDQLVVGEQGCVPGADGSAAPTFAIPENASVGNHQVRVSLRRPGFSSQLSSSFRVTAPRSGGGSTSGGGTGSSRTPTASPSPSASPTPSDPSPSATSADPTPAGGGGTDPQSEVEADSEDSGLPGVAVALIAAGAGLVVAVVTFRLVSRRAGG